MERYMDAKLTVEERAKDLLSKMSLEEKMGQIRCYLGGRGRSGRGGH